MLTLSMKNGNLVVKGPWIQSNLYQLRFTLKTPAQKQTNEGDYVFTTQDTLSWEVWH